MVLAVVVGPAEAFNEVVDELVDAFVRAPVQVGEVCIHVADGLDAVPDVVEVDVDRCAVFTEEPVELAGWNDHFWHLNTARTAPEPMQDGTRYDMRFRITPPEDTCGTATLALRDVHGGLFNGFAWSWDA